MKIIFKTILTLFILFIVFILHMTFFGIETDKFNNQIKNRIKDVNQNLEIELKEIKMTLDPFKFKLNVKTVGTEFSINDKIIELESINSEISLLSFFNREYSIQNLEISTKSLNIKNFISFVRILNNTPELFILEKIIKKGYLIADIKFNFDNTGKIKNDFQIKGFVKDLHADSFLNYKVKKLDLKFDYKKDNLIIQNINSSINNKDFTAKKILVNKENDEFFVNGDFVIDNTNVNNKELNNFLKFQIKNFEIDNALISAKNDFSLKINKKYKINDFKIFSEMKIHNMSLILKDHEKFINIFPEIKKNLNFYDQLINIKFSKKELTINGNGKVLLQNENDKIIYSILKKKDIFEFNTSLEINNNPVIFKILNFSKNDDSKLAIELNGIYDLNKSTKISSLIIKEKKNIFKINGLILDKKFKFKELRDLSFDYIDREKQKNLIKLFYKNDIYFLKGQNFNANNLIETILSDDQDTDSFFSKGDVKINIEIDKVYLDKTHQLKKLKGNLNFTEKELKKSNLSANFSNGGKLEFTVSSKQDEKITILTMHRAESLVKRYKFIKGFEGGILDFYSSKINDLSKSTLKIYDFKLKELPLLTKILTLASLQGIADILSGEGIRFDEFEMNFQTKKNLITIDEIYCIGPAISILMDGYVEKNKIVSLSGTLVPATTINKAIGSIPVLGKILVGSKTGEGVFGVSFKIKGPPKNLATTVNPIKTLTPRFITRTLEKIKKN